MQGMNHSVCCTGISKEKQGWEGLGEAPARPLLLPCSSRATAGPGWEQGQQQGWLWARAAPAPSFLKHCCSQSSQRLSSPLIFTKFSQGWTASVLLLADPFTHLSF